MTNQEIEKLVADVERAIPGNKKGVNWTSELINRADNLYNFYDGNKKKTADKLGINGNQLTKYVINNKIKKSLTNRTPKSLNHYNLTFLKDNSYLFKNVARINNQKEQKPTNLGKSYHEKSFEGIPLVEKLNQRFKTNSISRTDVFELYKNEQDWSLALIATMAWGGIRKSNFKKLLNHISKNDRQINELRLRINNMINDDHFIGLYQLMDDDFKINGIGPSYFTKIFFFAGNKSNSKIKPIILDKWTMNAYCAILLENGDSEKAKAFFSDIRFNTNGMPGETSIKSGKLSSEIYDFFVRDINHWSMQLNTTPAKLEQFIFGNKLNQDSSPSNPRKELWSIILENKNHLI